MKKEYKTIILEIILNIFLFLILCFYKNNSRILLAFFLTIYAITLKFLIKTKNTKSIHSRQVFILMIGFSLINVSFFYLTGLHFGYVESNVKLSLWSIVRFIIPIVVIIIASEIIRNLLIINEKKSSKTLILTATVMIDLIVYAQIYDLTVLQDFLKAIGFILFASVSSNLLYTYICEKFDYKGIIIYRIITSIYMYLIPIVPNVHIFIRSVLRMIYPYLIYLTLEYAFGKKTKATEFKEKRRANVYSIIIITITILLAMLISCNFRYGTIVIGSMSMKGTLDKGDAVIFEKYTNQQIEKGQVIIFTRNKLKMVHRITDIKTVNDVKRYYTKGDANIYQDDGFIEKKDILGICKFKIPYIGFPTLWINSLFETK